MCYLRLPNPTVTHTQEKRASSTLSGRASFSREFGDQDKQAGKLQVSTLTPKIERKGLLKVTGANIVSISP